MASREAGHPRVGHVGVSEADHQVALRQETLRLLLAASEAVDQADGCGESGPVDDGFVGEGESLLGLVHHLLDGAGDGGGVHHSAS
jgi:hypothetical protein